MDKASVKKKIAGMILIVGLVMLIPLFSGCDEEVNKSPNTGITPKINTTATALGVEPVLEEEPVSVRLLFAGDVMAHEPQLVAQFNNETKSYDFNNNYIYVQPLISAVDIAFCNLETTLGGSPYTGYPTFSSPDSLANALVSAGFDVVSTSNNHMLDRHASGVRRTIETVRAAGLKNVGSQLEGENDFIIVSAGALNVGLVAYTYETARYNGKRTLNGIPVSDDLENMVNSFGFETFDADMARIEESIKNARNFGADMVICYFHWGNEYQRTQDDNQRNIAQKIALAGADMIVGSHPHVLQGMEVLDAGGRKVPVYYSMGNFISNQRTETTGSRFTEQGLMVIADVEFMPESKKILSLDTKVVPTWLDKYKNGERNVYAIIPLVGDYLSIPALQESGHSERASQALEYCVSLFGEGAIYAERLTE
ncbi:hypothetical protein FACS1894127_2980 [Clostridia bacterium]|nr:hypothetical protein FACS1894127_2980 [Clostridia bacterium]